jgi:hypothetical protein
LEAKAEKTQRKFNPRLEGACWRSARADEPFTFTDRGFTVTKQPEWGMVLNGQ